MSAYQTALCLLAATCLADAPPEGFRALFNERDLSGWHGESPHPLLPLTAENKTAELARQRADFPRHWSVKEGELVNSGKGPYATTDEAFGDFELRLEYKTIASPECGIYLRGTPQIQIYDKDQDLDPNHPSRRLAGLKLWTGFPTLRPPGEWNSLRVVQQGDLTTVWLNGDMVFDKAKQRWPAKGPIMLTTQGGEIRWRNLFIKPL